MQVSTVTHNLLFIDQENSYWLYFCLHHNADPVSRNYFKSEYKGAKLIERYGIELITETPTNKLNVKLRVLTIDQRTKGLGESSVKYL
jgi:hypothetical protein